MKMNTGQLTASSIDYLWLVLISVATVWSAEASYLSAHQVVTVGIELYTYWLSIPLAIFCGLKYVSNRPTSQGVQGLLARSIIFLFATSLSIAAWIRSDDLFLFWKLRTIPPRAWPQMIADLKGSGRKSADNEGRFFGADALPKSLDSLGSRADFIHGKGQWLTRTDYTGLIAYAEFGYKVRTWGLFVGPEKIVQEGWRGFRKEHVAQDAYFIIGIPRVYTGNK